MSRARLNYTVDAVIAVAFLVTALTGVVFLFPAPWIKALGLGMPGMLGISFRAWHWLHDWSGVVAAAGVVLHFALHWRWVVTMTRRTFGAEGQDRSQATRATPPAAPVPTTSVSPRPAHASIYRAGDGTERRVTRRGFVTGLAGVGVAVAGGVVLVKAASAVGLASSGATQQARASTQGGGTSSSGSGSASSSGSASGSSSSGSSSSGSGGWSDGQSGATQGGSGQGTTTSTRVSVDAASCVGCGRCLQTCPASVFAWDGSGRATAQSPDQCVLCHRCLQVCPASAITVNG